ncbi:uncharacterized protein SEPMUDRAFT_115497 [Sphaerulina musiva SO2202]|uniref:Uncharacterized protein n=1 Tax=Sphaerulina musiva (strain SO2202) TaxID=692275 RepID=M3C1M4_SPHMS|nr:uncharacterized protein SEPMUDRAFT_115497 [Sphaerulina musiva SO2202]EMF14211.1 hypothetical protein SEPMUDRAFT_115497 [Sphaerulina musiva SO2202]
MPVQGPLLFLLGRPKSCQSNLVHGCRGRHGVIVSVLAIDPDEYLVCASPYYEDDTFVPDDAVTFLVCGALNGTAGNPDGKITQTNTLDGWLHCTGLNDFYSKCSDEYLELCIKYGAQGIQCCPPIGDDPDNAPSCNQANGNPKK